MKVTNGSKKKAAKGFKEKKNIKNIQITFHPHFPCIDKRNEARRTRCRGQGSYGPWCEDT
jgi:hypothetical protein